MTDQGLTVRTLLSADMTAELADRLESASREKVSTFTGLWCPETGFAAFVVFVHGAPVRWHITGPMTQDGAADWLRSMARHAEALSQQAERSTLTH